MSTVEIEQTPNGTVPDPHIIDQPVHASKDDWLTGAGDREEVDVDVPGLGKSVRIKALSAGMAAQIQQASMTLKGDSMTLDLRRKQVLTFTEGVIEPGFSEHEANQIAERWAGAFRFVVEAIDEISATSPDAIEKFRTRFRPRR